MINNDRLIRDMACIDRFVHHPGFSHTHTPLNRNSDIYYWNTDSYQVVIKCIPLTKLAATPRKFMKVSQLPRLDGEPFMEIKMLTETSRMQHLCPHYLQMFHWRVYDGHVYRNSNITQYHFSKTSVVLYLRAMEMDCHEWTKKMANRTDLQCRAMVFQILFALMVMHQHLGFVHGDAHIGNVLCSRDTTSVLNYVIKKRTFQVPNTGMHWVISDFGRSRNIAAPDESDCDPSWSDTPTLDIVNFLTSVHCHVAKSALLKNRISLILQFLKNCNRVSLHCIFDMMFEDFYELKHTATATYHLE